ncbi:hypothetical protein Pla22_23770 [Rubripirellula amarantea]|uniref:Uncharacterized protein n=1 Tax=Rubripirellula amarantea TaxID=2527999 RepID=A0A5C5WXV5_9BACT|nr:hypothetical protein Pla22_23770 [Rubripirellula amarantea]
MGKSQFDGAETLCGHMTSLDGVVRLTIADKDLADEQPDKSKRETECSVESINIHCSGLNRE